MSRSLNKGGRVIGRDHVESHAGAGPMQLPQRPYCTQPSPGPLGIAFLISGRAWGVAFGGEEAERIDFGSGEILSISANPVTTTLVASVHSGGVHQLLMKDSWDGPTKVLHSQDTPMRISGWASSTSVMVSYPTAPGWTGDSAFELDILTGLRKEWRWAAFSTLSWADGYLVGSDSTVPSAEFAGYRGGAAGIIWGGTSIGGLNRLSTPDGNPSSAVAFAGRVWFLDDPDRCTNIYSRSRSQYAPDVTKHTNFGVRGLRDLRAGQDGLVFELDGDLWSYDIVTGVAQPIEVRIPPETGTPLSPERRVPFAPVDTLSRCFETGTIGVLASGRLDFYDSRGSFLHSFPPTEGLVQSYCWNGDGQAYVACSREAASSLQLWNLATRTGIPIVPPEPLDFCVEGLASHSHGIVLATSAAEVLNLEISEGEVNGDFQRLNRKAALQVSDLYADPDCPYVTWVHQDDFSGKQIIVVNTGTGEREQLNPPGQELQSPVIGRDGKDLFFLARPTNPLAGTAAPSQPQSVLCAVRLDSGAGKSPISKDVRVLARGVENASALALTAAGIASLNRSTARMLWPTPGHFVGAGAKFVGDAKTIAFELDDGRLQVDALVFERHSGEAPWGTKEDRAALFWEVIHIIRSYAWHGDDERWRVASLYKYKTSLERVETLADTARVLRQLLGELGASHSTVSWAGPPTCTLADDRALGAATSYFDGFRRWVIQKPSVGGVTHSPSPITGINGSAIPVGVDPYAVPLPESGRSYATLRVAEEGEQRVDFALPMTLSGWYADEIRDCCEIVAEATRGSAQYVHLPDVSTAGMKAVERLCRGWDESTSVIVDLRSNEGGPYADYLSGLLQNLVCRGAVMIRGNARNILLGGPRKGIVLINERTGSGGEILAAALSRSPYFTLAGARTFGAGTGFTRTHKLCAGLVMTVPEFELRNSAKGAGIENRGVEPDIAISRSPELQRPLANADLLSAARLVAEDDYKGPIP